MDLFLRVAAVLGSMLFALLGLIVTAVAVMTGLTHHPASGSTLDTAPVVVPAIPVPAPAPAPTPSPSPDKPDQNKPSKRRAILPWNAGDPFQGVQRPPNAVEGGLTSPDGKETVMLDLQPALRLKNTGGMGRGGPGTGAGLCVFTSLNHAAFVQHVKCLQDLQKRMMSEPGGGYPQKVDQYIKRFCPDMVGKYTQLANFKATPEDLTLLRDVLLSGRLPCITYDGTLDPHYHYQHIEHMVNLIHLSPDWAAILDNNFIRDNQIIWMKPAALAWMLTAGHSRPGWVVVFHAPGRLPIPHNSHSKEGE